MKTGMKIAVLVMLFVLALSGCVRIQQGYVLASSLPLTP